MPPPFWFQRETDRKTKLHLGGSNLKKTSRFEALSAPAALRSSPCRTAGCRGPERCPTAPGRIPTPEEIWKGPVGQWLWNPFRGANWGGGELPGCPWISLGGELGRGELEIPQGLSGFPWLILGLFRDSPPHKPPSRVHDAGQWVSMGVSFLRAYGSEFCSDSKTEQFGIPALRTHILKFALVSPRIGGSSGNRSHLPPGCSIVLLGCSPHLSGLQPWLLTSRVDEWMVPNRHIFVGH